MLRQICTHWARTETPGPLVVTFGINGFWRRVDPMGRIIGDDCFETSRSRSGSTLINWRESQEFCKASGPLIRLRFFDA